MTSRQLPDERELQEVDLLVYRVDESCPKCGAALTGQARFNKHLVLSQGANANQFVQSDLEAMAAQVVADHMPSCPQRGAP